MPLTVERLKEVLFYDPATGEFAWIAGHRAWLPTGGASPRGYKVIMVDQRLYSAHRLAWLYMTGAWPTKSIDHANQIGSDNRWCNLREATPTQQNANVPVKSSSRSGVKGVRFRDKKRKWCAEIRISGKKKCLGYFDKIEDAARAYRTKARELYGEFASF